VCAEDLGNKSTQKHGRWMAGTYCTSCFALWHLWKQRHPPPPHPQHFPETRAVNAERHETPALFLNSSNSIRLFQEETSE